MTQRRALAVAIAIACGTSACLDDPTSRCGDLICVPGAVCAEGHGCVNPDQLSACDGKANGDSCSVLGGAGRCSDGLCVPVGCGDGVKAPSEACDDTDLGGVSDCTDLGYYQSGAVSCTSDCTFDVSACKGICGDGTINGPEQCEPGTPADLNGKSCSDFGFYSEGTGLGCSAACTFDTSGCAGYCGDGVVNGDEQCDGDNLGDKTNCTDYGFYDSAPLTCNASCQHNLSQCTGTCGDGVANGTEDCDGSDLAGTDCTTLGYYDATGLACNDLCALDDSGCTGYCGDRVQNGGEACDGRAPAKSCVDYGFEGGAVGCALCGPDFSDCQQSAWTVPGTTPGSMAGLWGDGAGTLFAVGIGGRIARWDGSSWTVMTSGTTQNLHGVWGSSAADVFVVGDSGTILHWNGTSWSALSSGVTDNLLGVWGSGTNNVIAVGAGGVILHWNGASWSAIPSGTAEELRAVWGSGPNDVFAVGGSQTILHWDGASVSTTTLGSVVALDGVWGSGPNDVFAVGRFGDIVHYDGVTWDATASGTDAALLAVWGSGPQDVFAVGERGLILNWNGSYWAPVSSPTTRNLRAIWGSSARDTFVVGDTVTLHQDGSRWVATITSGNILYSVWGASADDVFAVGYVGVMRHWDGTTWTAVPSGTSKSLLGLWGAAADDIYAVGESGTIRHYNGSTWSSMTSGTTQFLRAIDGNDASDIYAVGDGGTILHWNGSTWSPMTSGTTNTLQGVWSAGPGDVYAVGVSGTILHWNGSTWATLTSPTTEDLYGIWGSSPTDVFAVGNFAILHSVGTQWTLTVLPNTLPRAIWGRGPEDVFAAGFQGAILHWDGARWSPMRSGTINDFFAAWGTAPGDVFLTGSAILHRPQSCAASETNCSDGVEDDCDGLIDCADPDCSGDATCAAGGLCAAATTLSCGGGMSDTTSGGTNLLSAYACDDWLRTGREKTYRIQRATAGDVTVTLTGLNRDVDLLALDQGAAGGCNPRNPGCLAASSNIGTGDESVTFTAQGAHDYFLVVDSFGQRSATYTISVSCP